MSANEAMPARITRLAMASSVRINTSIRLVEEMTVDAVSFARLPAPRFAHNRAPAHVLAMRHSLEMCGIDARAVATHMV
jgi:hypothetical protein